MGVEAKHPLRVKDVFSILKKQKKSTFHFLQEYMETGMIDLDS